MSKLCECGCGQRITWKSHYKTRGYPRFMVGHGGRGISSPRKGQHLPKAHRDNISKALTGKIVPKKIRKKVSKAVTKIWKSENCPFDMSGLEKGHGWNRNKKTPLKTRQRQSEARLRYFERNLRLFGFKMLPKTVKKCLARSIPSGLEKKMIQIIDKNSLPYKYVGDGSFLIGNKNPDFVNINGEKIAVEVFGSFHKLRDYGKIENYKSEREKIFKTYGWDVIFFQDNEVNENNVIKKLNHGGG